MLNKMLQRRRTLNDLQPNEPLVDLTEASIVLQFADSVRALSPTRRQSIWIENVTTNDEIQSQTKSQQQMDDILLFLIIIFAKEEYPDEEQELVSVLKEFISSKPFVALKAYIKQKYFPLYQEEFIHNNEYFAGMMEDYAHNQLDASLKRKSTMHSESPSSQTLSKSGSLHQMMDTLLYTKLEEKMMDIFALKFGEIEAKLNKLEKEIYSIKNTLKPDKTEPNMEKRASTNDIMKEIHKIKKEMLNITAGTVPTRIRSKSGMMMSNKHKKKYSKAKAQRKPSGDKRKMGIERSVSMALLSPNNERERKRPNKRKSSSKKLKRFKKRNNHKERDIAVIAKRKEELKTWLDTECELSEYFEVFIENGLDNLDIIQHVKIADLVLMGVSNNAHKMKIMQNIQKLKYEESVRHTSAS